jgi:hypothetical protein
MEQAVIVAAGPEAQRRAAPRSRVPAGGVSDRAEIERLAHLLASDPKAERALVQYAMHEAATLVSGHRLAIAAVAAALEESEALNGNQIAAIVGDAEERAHPHLHLVPSDSDIDTYRAAQHRRARTVQRRDIADAVLQHVLQQFVTGDGTLTADDIDAAVRQPAERRGLDADGASDKLHCVIEQHRIATGWRPFVPTLRAVQ